MVQPVMRSLRRNHGRPRINSVGRDTRETVRAERTGGSGAEHGRPSTIPETDKTARRPPVTEGISPKSRGDERTEIPETPSGWEDGPGYGSLKASCRGPAGGRRWRDLQEGYQNRDMKGRLCTIQPGPRPV